MPDPRFVLISDSTCDLPLDFMAQHDVTVVPLTVTVDEDSFLDQVEISSQEFYDRMAASDKLPHSSQPAPQVFSDVYAKLAADGATDILVVTIGEALSGTANSARLAAKEASANVKVFDSRSAAMGHGVLVREAIGMRDAGATIDECIDHLEMVHEKAQTLIIPATLENLVKGGRASSAAGLMSSLLDIKVEMEIMRDDGHIEPIAKAKGLKRIFAHTVADIVNEQGEGAHVCISFGTVRNDEGCSRLVELLRHSGLTVDVIDILDCSPVIATHGGMGLIALTVFPASLRRGI